MKSYNLILEYAEGNFFVDIFLCKVISAHCETEALNKAKQLSKLICEDITLYFNFKDNDLKIQQGLTLDKTIMLALLSPILTYKFYDRTLGDDIALSMGDGTTLYPVMNPNSIIIVAEEKWQLKISAEYAEYRKRKKKDYLIFECISFGVEVAD